MVSLFQHSPRVTVARVGYRFDYRGRSIVVGRPGTVQSPAAAGADIVLPSTDCADVAEIHDLLTKVSCSDVPTRGVILVTLPLQNSDVSVESSDG
jgi:hypothetical protein